MWSNHFPVIDDCEIVVLVSTKERNDNVRKEQEIHHVFEDALGRRFWINCWSKCNFNWRQETWNKQNNCHEKLPYLIHPIVWINHVLSRSSYEFGDLVIQHGRSLALLDQKLSFHILFQRINKSLFRLYLLLAVHIWTFDRRHLWLRRLTVLVTHFNNLKIKIFYLYNF